MSLEKEDKNYFTFLEIIMMLRDEYKSVHKLLGDLSRNITIDSKYDSTFDMKVALKDEIFNLPVVVLSVSKKPNLPSIAFRQFMNKYFHDDLRRIVDNATFILDDSLDFSFEQLNKLYLKNEFSPRVLINDEEKFSEEYVKLRESSLLELPFMRVRLNSNQVLSISGDSISLSTDDGGSRKINIRYDGSSDNIKVDSNIRYDNSFIEKLLNTEISKSELPLEYISLFSNSEADTNVDFKDDMGGRRDEVLEFVEKPKSLSLIKRNYK